MSLRKAEPNAYTQRDLELAERIAAHLAGAITNSDLFERVQASNEQLRSMSNRIVEVQEHERRYIANELHDKIGQTLTGLKLTLEASAKSLNGAASLHLSEANNLVNELMTRVRELSLDLRPSLLDDLGVLPVLLWHFKRYKTQTNILVNFTYRGLSIRFTPEIETAAYRIVQEGLTNVARHACASEVSVHIYVDQDVLNILIDDKGAGFDMNAATASGSLGGITGMHERAKFLGPFRCRNVPRRWHPPHGQIASGERGVNRPERG